MTLLHRSHSLSLGSASYLYFCTASLSLSFSCTFPFSLSPFLSVSLSLSFSLFLSLSSCVSSLTSMDDLSVQSSTSGQSSSPFNKSDKRPHSPHHRTSETSNEEQNNVIRVAEEGPPSKKQRPGNLDIRFLISRKVSHSVYHVKQLTDNCLFGLPGCRSHHRQGRCKYQPTQEAREYRLKAAPLLSSFFFNSHCLFSSSRLPLWYPTVADLKGNYSVHSPFTFSNHTRLFSAPRVLTLTTNSDTLPDMVREVIKYLLENVSVYGATIFSLPSNYLSLALPGDLEIL